MSTNETAAGRARAEGTEAGSLSGEPAEHASAEFSISDLALEFALTPRAIRFYEDSGLIKPRRVGTRRIYGVRERTRLKLVLRGKRLGLSLSEIREILDLYDSREGDSEQLRRFAEILGKRREQLLSQREDLDVVLAEVQALERDCRRRLRERGGTRRKTG